MANNKGWGCGSPEAMQMEDAQLAIKRLRYESQTWEKFDYNLRMWCSATEAEEQDLKDKRKQHNRMAIEHHAETFYPARVVAMPDATAWIESSISSLADRLMVNKEDITRIYYLRGDVLDSGTLEQFNELVTIASDGIAFCPAASCFVCFGNSATHKETIFDSKHPDLDHHA